MSNKPPEGLIQSDQLGSTGESSNVHGNMSVCPGMRLVVHVITTDDVPVVGADVTLVQENRTIRTNVNGDADFDVVVTARPLLVATKPLHYSLDGSNESRFSFAEKGKKIQLGERREITLVLDPIEIQMFLDADRNGSLTCEGLDRWEFGAGKKGAIVLCNNDDDDRTGNLDNRDEVINGGDDAGEIAPLNVRVRCPFDPIAAGITATLSLHRAEDHDRIRIFDGRFPGAVAILGPKNRAPFVLDLSKPLQPLGMEALRYDVGDEPEIVILLTIRDNHGGSFVQRACVRVAPWMMQHHLEPPVRVFAAKWALRARNNQPFRTRLRFIVEALGLVFDETFDSLGDRWAQDCMEFGCSNLRTVATQSIMSAPRSMGLIQCIPTLLAPSMGLFGFHSTSNRDLDKFGNLEVTPPVFDRAGNHYPWGRIYYGGRGGHDEIDKRVRDVVHGQRVQRPFRVDTSWLDVGHADEIISFVPAGGGWKICLPSVDIAFELLDIARIIDPGALLLKDREVTGSEGEGFFEPVGTTVNAFLGKGQSGPSSSRNPPSSQKTTSPPPSSRRSPSEKMPSSRPSSSSSQKMPSSSERVPSSSRPSMLQRPTGMHPGLMGEMGGGFGRGPMYSMQSTMKFNRDAANGIAGTLVDLEEKIRLVPDKIFWIPILFCAGRMGRAAAMTGNMVNMLVLGTTCVMSKPYGPEISIDRLLMADAQGVLSDRLDKLGIDVTEVGALMAHMAVVDGTPGQMQPRIDLFALYVWCAMKRENLTPCFIDSWAVYHNSGGEVHCATNTLRERRIVRWWEFGDGPQPPLIDLHDAIEVERRWAELLAPRPIEETAEEDDL